MILEYQLQFDNDKYTISKQLYNLIITQTNYISDYGQCRRFVRESLSKYANEVKQVRDFAKKQRNCIEI